MSEPWIDFIIKILIGIGIITIILIVQAIIGYIIKKKLLRRKNAPIAAINGIFYIIRMIFGIIILMVTLSYFGIIDSNATLNFTTIISTAIGFSSTIAIGNLVAGFYMILSKPYRVGDYIHIGDIEGFVTEIGINFTKIRDTTKNILIRIPNKVAMNEDLLVYKLNPEKQDRKIEKPNNLREKLKVLNLGKEEIVRYLLPIETELEMDSNLYLNTLEGVFERWTNKFGYKPSLLITKIGTTVVKGNIIISANNMEIIQEDLDKFLDDLWYALYSEVKNL